MVLSASDSEDFLEGLSSSSSSTFYSASCAWSSASSFSFSSCSMILFFSLSSSLRIRICYMNLACFPWSICSNCLASLLKDSSSLVLSEESSSSSLILEESSEFLVVSLDIFSSWSNLVYFNRPISLRIYCLLAYHWVLRALFAVRASARWASASNSLSCKDLVCDSLYSDIVLIFY